MIHITTPGDFSQTYVPAGADKSHVIPLRTTSHIRTPYCPFPDTCIRHALLKLLPGKDSRTGTVVEPHFWHGLEVPAVNYYIT